MHRKRILLNRIVQQSLCFYLPCVHTCPAEVIASVKCIQVTAYLIGATDNYFHATMDFKSTSRHSISANVTKTIVNDPRKAATNHWSVTGEQQAQQAINNKQNLKAKCNGQILVLSLKLRFHCQTIKLGQFALPTAASQADNLIRSI